MELRINSTDSTEELIAARDMLSALINKRQQPTSEAFSMFDEQKPPEKSQVPKTQMEFY